jgi:hypothetical protein
VSAYWLTGDTRKVTAEMAAAGVEVDLILTSPPFLALRSYLPDDHPDKGSEIGSEPNPAEFVDTLLELTAGWGTVLAPHGTIAVELGDTYAGSGGAGGDYAEDGLREGQTKFTGSARAERWGMNPDSEDKGRGKQMRSEGTRGNGWPDDKSLCMIPELYRVALAYGIHPLTGQPSPAGRWRVRNNVTWVRPNPPVGALGDKFRPGTSDMAIACKARDRWFDLDAVRTKPQGQPDVASNGPKAAQREAAGIDGAGRYAARIDSNPAGAPPLDWWSISPGGYSGAHYAVFPPELLVRPIEAMCPRRVCLTCGKPSRRETTNPNALGKTSSVGAASGGLSRIPKSEIGYRVPDNTTSETTGWSSCGCPGTDGIRLDGFHTGTGWRPGRVLDPFGGSGTSGLVATGHGRDCVLIDLDGRNANLARERIGMWFEESTVAELAASWVRAPLGAAS